MAVTDVLRPVSVRKTGGGTAVPSGTLATVTADNSDSTYIQFPLASADNNWSLRVGSHTPAAGYQRHAIRGRVRIRADVGTLDEDIDLGRGTDDYGFYETVTATTAFTDQPTSWISFSFYGLDTAGALSDLNVGGGYPANPTGGGAQLRTAECYVDIDCRFHPDFTPQIQDNAGVDQSGGTVTDTNQPDLYFGTAAYDGLPPLNWAVVVKSGAVTVFSQSGTGQPPTTVQTLGGLANGAYTATFTVRSTIRGADPFEWSVDKSFSVANTVPPPSPPLVSVDREFGGYRVTWTNPSGQAWDDGYVVAEVWREDCVGNQRIATIPDGLNGSYLDLAIPQLDPQRSGPDCEVSTEPCDITYSVRYWGYVSTFVELPDTIPADMILGWPSTAASIPSGWTRVTALDGFYPRGASVVTAPSVTGGAASHSHTTDPHRHTINAHSHAVGGSTNSSNSSVTSARYNGAGQSQADQPHAHALPLNTGNLGAVNSGFNTPATSVANNLPLTREVIWIKSDGAQANYPVGILGWATEAVSGWINDAVSLGRYLRGAAAAGNGGASSGAATHTHSVNSHTHTGVSHTHPIANTGLSIPLSSLESGSGVATPRYLPRHTHPVSVDTAATDPLTAAGGGTTGAGTLEPPNRRLKVIQNTGGGTQTRVIGLFTGAVSALDPLLTLCNGGNGTPDMRTWFARDAGSDSINSTGGFATHGHTTPNHDHATGPHNHGLTISVSGTGSFEAPTFGDLGSSPSTGHTHSSGDTGNTTPSIGDSTSGGNTSIVSTLPPFKEVHFVRLDGTISGGPLPVPELKVTEFATVTVPSFVYGDDLDRLASMTEIIAVTTDRSHTFPRLVADSTPVTGGLHSVSTTLAGEDMSLVIAAEGLPAINRLEGLLSSDRVYWSPVGGTPGWYAPGGWTVAAPVANVKVLSITMVRQPWPATPDPSEFL